MAVCFQVIIYFLSIVCFQAVVYFLSIVCFQAVIRTRQDAILKLGYFIGKPE